jgi:hypothetical protein
MMHCAIIAIAFETFSQQSFVAPVIKILNNKTIVLLFISLQTLVDQTWITCISIRSDLQLYMYFFREVRDSKTAAF